jgi:O-6-methylguanine DNA methyltransferase
MGHSNFREAVLKIVRRIPRGKVLTYKKVSQLAGRPNAARAVGSILRTNFNPAIPCHRVVRSDGNIGGYNRGVGNKIRLLQREGIRFTHDPYHQIRAIRP